MRCPRCGLINPESAQRCDCGYDFQTQTVEKAYFSQELPRTIKTFLVVIILVNIAGGAYALLQGSLGKIIPAVVWSVIVYWLYFRLVKKDNWARIALVIVTFPWGLLVGLSREARLYCMQK